MPVYIFMRIKEPQAWGVYHIAPDGHPRLVKAFNRAPDAKRHTDYLRRRTALALPPIAP